LSLYFNQLYTPAALPTVEEPPVVLELWARWAPVSVWDALEERKMYFPPPGVEPQFIGLQSHGL